MTDCIISQQFRRVTDTTAEGKMRGKMFRIAETLINVIWLSVAALHGEDFKVLFTPQGVVAWQHSGKLNNNKGNRFL